MLPFNNSPTAQGGHQAPNDAQPHPSSTNPYNPHTTAPGSSNPPNVRPIQNPTISAQTQLNTHANLVPYFVSKLVLSTADLSDFDKRNALLCASTASTLRLASLVFGAGTPVSGPLNDTIRMSYFRYCMGSALTQLQQWCRSWNAPFGGHSSSEAAARALTAAAAQHNAKAWIWALIGSFGEVPELWSLRSSLTPPEVAPPYSSAPLGGGGGRGGATDEPRPGAPASQPQRVGLASGQESLLGGHTSQGQPYPFPSDPARSTASPATPSSGSKGKAVDRSHPDASAIQPQRVGLASGQESLLGGHTSRGQPYPFPSDPASPSIPPSGSKGKAVDRSHLHASASQPQLRLTPGQDRLRRGHPSERQPYSLPSDANRLTVQPLVPSAPANPRQLSSHTRLSAATSDTASQLLDIGAFNFSEFSQGLMATEFDDTNPLAEIDGLAIAAARIQEGWRLSNPSLVSLPESSRSMPSGAVSTRQMQLNQQWYALVHTYNQIMYEQLCYLELAVRYMRQWHTLLLRLQFYCESNSLPTPFYSLAQANGVFDVLNLLTLLLIQKRRYSRR